MFHPALLTSAGTLTGFVQSETDTSFEDAVYSGAYPADTEFIVDLVNNSYYCYRTVGYYNASTANWNTETLGTWVPILATVKSSQTISLSTPVTQTYGTASVNLATFTSTSSLTVSLSSNTTDVCEINSSGVITIKAAGICSITGSQAGNNSYYAADPVTITFEITKKVLTVTASSHNVRIGDAEPVITADYVGFHGSDTASVISGLSCSTTYTSSSAAGSYPTSCSGGSAANYTLTYVNGTVTASSSTAQSITFANPGTQTYGPSFTLATPPSATSGLSVTITSNSPSVCTVSGNVVTIVGVGTCSLSAAQAGGTNGGTTYSAATTVTITFTISQRPIVVTASSPSLNYGDSIPTITPSYSANFAGSDTSSVVSGTSCTTTYTTTSAFGTTPTTSCSGATATNYSFTYTSGAVTISQRPIVITASSSSLNYGDSIPTITPSYSANFAGSDTSSVVSGTSCTTTYTTTSAFGTTPTTSCSGATATNYSFTYTSGAVTISQRPIVITASSSSLNYGASIPTITPSYSANFAGSDTSSVVSGTSCTTTYTTTSAFGTTPTTSCSGATATNYSFTYTSGAVTISQRPIVVTASSPSLNYGDSIPTITPSYSANFAGSDTSSVVSGTSCTTTYTTTSAFGTTPTTSCSGATATNYSFTYTSGAVTISQRPIVITASSSIVELRRLNSNYHP